MGTALKLAAAGAIAGLLLALTVTEARHRSTIVPIGAASSDLPPATPDQSVLAHCRAITVADADCSAAWEAQRRHFFGKGGQP